MTLASHFSGKNISDIEHLKESIVEILSTPIGTRIMRREFGSRIFDLLDYPVNQFLIIELMAATAEAIDLWEPRLKIQRVEIEDVNSGNGEIRIALEGFYLPQEKPIRLEGVTIG